MSPFTSALLNHLFEPGLDIRIGFGRVRDEVLRKTGNKQEPFVSGSLGGGHIALVPAPAAQTVTVPDPAVQLNDYNLAKEIGTKGAWESFLAQHPSGYYADLARQQVAKLAAPEQQNTTAAERGRIEREQAERRARLEDGERQRLEQERLAKEQAEREGLERERISREQAERERIQQERIAKQQPDQRQPEQAANLEPERQKDDDNEPASAAAPTETALLTPRVEPAASLPVSALAGGALIVEIKKELSRVGCYQGSHR